MELIFENERGTIKMDGGKGDAEYKIKSSEGLGFINQSVTAEEYYFLLGQKTVARSPLPRLITVSFDCGEAGKSCEGELARIVHDKGRLYIRDKGKKVYADAYVSSLGKTTVYGKNYERYVIQFTCDYPYFRDEDTKVCGLFERIEFIKNIFTLPMIFSKRTVGQDIFIGGDKDVYPIITIGGISGEEEFRLLLTNESTGAALELDLPKGKYGIIEYNLREGKITCGGEDFTTYLSDESYMSDFYLQRGENKIRITAGGINVNSAASIIYEEEYISALEG